MVTGRNWDSAIWYSNPSQASTWNYMSGHIRCLGKDKAPKVIDLRDGGDNNEA